MIPDEKLPLPTKATSANTGGPILVHSPQSGESDSPQAHTP